ncbi:phage antirepressor KilAC domain-containing protein [Metapseudomonas sp. CR1201]
MQPTTINPAPRFPVSQNVARTRMTSREIAELVEKRHDNVKRTIEALVERGVIESPQIEEIPTSTKPAAVYVFAGERGKRDSIVVVAQLCPEFTARLTDAAKHLGVQRIKLIEWLRANRWIYRREGSAHWLAYQPRMASGLLEHKVTVIGTDEIGDQRLASQVRVTPKGLAKLAEKVAEGAL